MVEKKELDKLARRFGKFDHARFEYRNLSPGFAEWVTRLTRRRGEVVLVVPRRDGRFLLHTKPHYPDNLFRLPTGGIHAKEPAAEAAQRETQEEIGFTPRELKLLGILENVFWIREQEFHYPSFVFETEPYTQLPKPTDPDELISGFRDVDVLELGVVALHLASLPARWSEWGKFRAAPHTWLAEHLSKK